MATSNTTVDDFLAIADLVNRYGFAVDARDWERLQACFTDDAVVTDYLGRDIRGGGAGVVESYKPQLDPYPVTQHMAGMPQVAIDGDTARGSVYLIGVHSLPGAPGGDTCVIGVRYDDEYARTTAGWQISRRRINPLWTVGNTGVFEQTGNVSP